MTTPLYLATLRTLTDGPKKTGEVRGALRVTREAADSRLRNLMAQGLVERELKIRRAGGDFPHTQRTAYWALTPAGTAALEEE